MMMNPITKDFTRLIIITVLLVIIITQWVLLYLGDPFKSRGFVRISQPPTPYVKKNVGMHMELYCEAMGSPPPTIQWYKDHLRITEVRYYSLESDNKY